MQTQGIHQMLLQCWASVEYGGSTLKQHFQAIVILREIKRLPVRSIQYTMIEYISNHVLKGVSNQTICI